MDEHPLLDPHRYSHRHQVLWARRLKRAKPIAKAAHWQPPRCPHPGCRAHSRPEGQWFQRKGSYWTLCRARPDQRFRCKLCGKTFSLSAFRADRWDKKPWHNPDVIARLSAGIGLRETARLLGMSRTALQMKARKLSKHCHYLHRNLLQQSECGPAFMMDEAVVFEGDRRLRPLSLAVLIDKSSWLILDAFAAPRAPHGNRTRRTIARIQRMEQLEGVRKDRHKTAVAKVMRTMAWTVKLRQPRVLQLEADQEPTYRPLFSRVCRVLSGTRVSLVQHKGDAEPRDFRNPLFKINHTLALMRDRVGRFRRRSWLNSKRRVWLNRMVSMFLCVRNYVRPFRNDADATPGELAGIPAGRLSYQQLAGWRQDWGVARSLSPTARVA